MKKLLPILFMLLSGPLAAQDMPAAPGAEGYTQVEREMVCPVCGTLFVAKLDAGTPNYDQQLDLKPVGDLTGPWLIPECPKCGFVVYKAGFEKAELARCKAAVASDEYKKALKRSSYYRAGLLYERLEKPPFATGMNFLRASWQEEGNPPELKEDQELALRYFTDFTKTSAPADPDWQNAQLVRGELLRRLGKFGQAKAHFLDLQGRPEFKKNFLGDVARFQVTLCDKQDAGPHLMQEVRDFTKPLPVRLWIMTKKFFADLKGAFTGR